jgi:hypothetical protein
MLKSFIDNPKSHLETTSREQLYTPTRPATARGIYNDQHHSAQRSYSEDVAEQVNLFSPDQSKPTSQGVQFYDYLDCIDKSEFDRAYKSDYDSESPQPVTHKSIDFDKYCTDSIYCSEAPPFTPQRGQKSQRQYGLQAYSPSVYSEDDGSHFTPPSKFPDLLPEPLSFSKRHQPGPQGPITPPSPTPLFRGGNRTALNHSSIFPPEGGTTQNLPPAFPEGDRTSSDHSSQTPASTEKKRSLREKISFLGSCLTASDPSAQMESLTVASALRASTRTKAVEDARAMQQLVIDGCKKVGKDPPKYVLQELIGKGSFGRVYKG